MKVVLERSGSVKDAVAVFNSGYSYLIVDDSCFVICNGTHDNLGSRAYIDHMPVVRPTHHIWPEALEILNKFKPEDIRRLR
jgi:hypothetical protein